MKIKVLLTGATGFLGSNILKGLIKNNYEVVILKRSFSSIKNIENVSTHFKSYNIDEVSIETVFETERNIDIVIHCATHYGRNQENASTVLESNLVFPLRVLEASIKKGVKMFINTDTSLNKQGTVQGYTQNYVLSKKQFRDWGKLYSDTSRIIFVNLILEHIYGPGDDSSKFIAFLIEKFEDNVKSIDLTKGEQERDFIYIDDVVNAYLAVSNNLYSFKGYHEFEVGSGNVIKIRELVELLKELMTAETKLNFGHLGYRENEVMFSKADILALVKLGWQPENSLKCGLLKYISSSLRD